MTFDGETIRGLGTLFLMLCFVGLCVWAYGPSRRARFDADAQIPFEDEAEERFERGRS